MESLFGDAPLEVEEDTTTANTVLEETGMADQVVPAEPEPEPVPASQWIPSAPPDPDDPELALVKSYLDIEEGKGLCVTAEQDAFQGIKGICTNHGLRDAERFDTHMQQLAERYMEDRWNNFDPQVSTVRQEIGRYATKRNGAWNLRKFRVPLQHRPTLEQEQIPFVEKEFTSKRAGTYTALVVNGVPDGFYSAWKTITRALDQGVVGWENMAKSEIDKAIKELKIPVQKAPDTAAAALDRVYQVELPRLMESVTQAFQLLHDEATDPIPIGAQIERIVSQEINQALAKYTPTP